jgi:hypothetical protein
LGELELRPLAIAIIWEVLGNDEGNIRIDVGGERGAVEERIVGEVERCWVFVLSGS